MEQKSPILKHGQARVHVVIADGAVSAQDSTPERQAGYPRNGRTAVFTRFYILRGEATGAGPADGEITPAAGEGASGL